MCESSNIRNIRVSLSLSLSISLYLSIALNSFAPGDHEVAMAESFVNGTHELCDANGNGNGTCPFKVDDSSLYHQPILVEIRVAVLWTCAVVGLLGNLFVLIWIATQRGHRSLSRVTLLIVHLTVADTMVLTCATLPQIVWEYAQRVWRAGDFGCRLFKFLQTFSITVSNYMVVALACDRHCAIRKPLHRGIKLCHFTGAAWGAAALVNFANFFLYEVVEVKGQPNCRSILYNLPDKSYFKAYMTVVALLIFFIPLVVICTCYLRIFQKIAQKASESKHSKRSSIKPGKVHLQATPSSSLPRAKAKTFKMTIVIVLSFFICSAPYFICEMWRFYGNQQISAHLYSVLAALAVSNSATDPFVFLLFNAGPGSWWLRKYQSKNKRSTYSEPASSIRISETAFTEVPEIPLVSSDMCKSKGSMLAPEFTSL